MKLGFIKPTYPGEKRVALLPEHIDAFENELVIEHGFGQVLGFSDVQYAEKGCRICSRAEVFADCDAVFCLKLLQPTDYDFIRNGQMIIGWTHPTGSGATFFNTIAQEKHLKIVDLDNIYPKIYWDNLQKPISFLEKNFIWRNSFIAGIASVQDALLRFGLLPDSSVKVAVLSSGNVAQGAFNYLSRMGVDVRMFYRKTMNEFYTTLSDYDVIVNGIEVDVPGIHILSKDDLTKVKKGCLLIDAAADAGNAIEGTHYASIDEPIYEEGGLYFYEVNNAPSLLFRNASYEISKAFSKLIYKYDINRFFDLIDQ